MDQRKKVMTSLEEDMRELTGVGEDSIARIAGLTESCGIPTVGTVSANIMDEEAFRTSLNEKKSKGKFPKGWKKKASPGDGDMELWSGVENGYDKPPEPKQSLVSKLDSLLAKLLQKKTKGADLGGVELDIWHDTRGGTVKIVLEVDGETVGRAFWPMNWYKLGSKDVQDGFDLLWGQLPSKIRKLAEDVIDEESDEEEDKEDPKEKSEGDCSDDEEDDDDEEKDEDISEEVIEEWKEVLGDDFDDLVTEAKKKKKKKKMDAFVAELAKRKDVRDPEALAGWLANYDPPNWSEDIDGEAVTEEMLNRFGALPFEVMEEDDFDRVIAELQTKTLAEDADDDLRTLAEEVAAALLEARKVAKDRKANKRGGVQRKMKCNKPGTDPKKMKHWDDKKKACVPNAGAYTVQRKVKTRKAGRGKQAVTTDKRTRRHKSMGIESFAGKLGAMISEDVDEKKVDLGVRDEVLERIDRIFVLIDEEFYDDDVAAVLLSVMEDLDEKSEAGLLAEDAMGEDEFIAALAPALKIIRECFDKIQEMEDSDDDSDEDDSDEDDSDEKDEDLLGNLNAL